MGSLSSILGMLPGVPRHERALKHSQINKHQMDRIEAILYSIAPGERRRPRITYGGRRTRIQHAAAARTVAERRPLLCKSTGPSEIEEVLRQMAGSRGGLMSRAGSLKRSKPAGAGRRRGALWLSVSNIRAQRSTLSFICGKR